MIRTVCPIAIFIVCALLSGCVTVSTVQPPGSETKLTDYKHAYIKPVAGDEWQLKQALLFELTDMGMEVLASPFKEPTSTDLLVKYSFESGWDFTKYLKTFQFQFIDAVSSRIVASTSYHSTGLWVGKRDGRLEFAFNDLRKKNGLPPTKQFR